MRVVVWIREGVWEAAVDAAGGRRAEATYVLLHVIPADVEGVMNAGLTGLLGRRHARVQVEEISPRLNRRCWQPRRPGSGGPPSCRPGKGATSARWWRQPKARICSSSVATATGAGSVHTRSAQRPASSSITHPARSCWSGRSQCPRSARSHRRQLATLTDPPAQPHPG